jgi:hypothetical protein
MSKKKQIVKFSYTPISSNGIDHWEYTVAKIKEVDLYEPFHFYVGPAIQIKTPLYTALMIFVESDQIKISLGQTVSLFKQENDIYSAVVNNPTNFTMDVTSIVTPIIRDFGCPHLRHDFTLIIV